ncbi:hypothetical protein FHS20_004446 [Phyllobacterium endophyticum]|uniref:Uncharacterized protein n=1 Tax=Phyllobacterium endophyticum TaxID=1149773 RepID=A0A2P7B0L9_9HYPH|nr:hypothetical protein [Phyllobacterium endophyticum]PSH60026.1 hypothetical protein CU100_04705 [Phyllobacterium endophyticum]
MVAGGTTSLSVWVTAHWKEYIDADECVSIRWYTAIKPKPNLKFSTENAARLSRGEFTTSIFTSCLEPFWEAAGGGVQIELHVLNQCIIRA